MIQIENLTQDQVDMLDHMWSLDSEEEYFEWYDALSVSDQKMADVLQRMILLAEADNLVEQTGYKDAASYLKKFALQ